MFSPLTGCYRRYKQKEALYSIADVKDKVFIKILLILLCFSD